MISWNHFPFCCKSPLLYTTSFDMQDKRKILNIERSLGFKWPWGISRKTKESCRVPVVKFLLNETGRLKEKYVDLTPTQLQKCSEFHNDCDMLFAKYGNKLWPSPPADRSAWLVDCNEENWEGQWTKNLDYNDENDFLMYDVQLSHRLLLTTSQLTEAIQGPPIRESREISREPEAGKEKDGARRSH
jgi:hypothetical protein